VTHPTAEDVYATVVAELPTISLKTVYQTLHELAELGELLTLDVGTGAARFDPNVETAHHHLVCRSCGKVRDVDLAIDGLSLPQELAQGYAVHRAEVVFRGLCDRCRPETPGRRRAAARRPPARTAPTRPTPARTAPARTAPARPAPARPNQ
jgi:Fe2+ or Zn2+ uptake regulation protein